MPVLDVRDVKKSFRTPDGDTTCIVDIPAFSMARDVQIGLKGASGSGKTTFLHLVAGILQADSGEIRVDDQPMTTQSESARDRLRARAIGYVFQSFNLLQGYTALENVMLGMLFSGGVDRSRAIALLKRVGLGHRLDYRPAHLSVGQQQRVAVARALANLPKLVLADEPTGNLDQRHAGEALALIREVCRENHAALLLVSHDPVALALFESVEDLGVLNRASGAHAPAASTEPVGSFQ